MDVTNIHTGGIRDQYDLIFSNSLIEHLGTWKNKRGMADAVLATGLPYFIQTPNYWFPMEPHWLIPGFQFLPRPTQVALLARRSTSFRTGGDTEEVRGSVDEIDLLTVKEMQDLFPGSAIMRERWVGMTKSIVAYNLDALQKGQRKDAASADVI